MISAICLTTNGRAPNGDRRSTFEGQEDCRGQKGQEPGPPPGPLQRLLRCCRCSAGGQKRPAPQPVPAHARTGNQLP